MLTIYHNPRCRKSREGLAILEASGKPFTVVKYLDTPLSREKIREILDKLGMPAKSLVRTGESIWKEKFRSQEFSEAELIQALADHPKLLERPVVTSDTAAVLGRPPERIQEFLKG
ncbi:arsenate reductase (glutaredoxin) [Robiginitalea sp. SC105]|uniref:arsenate reductase (glutaredoxin) n=1 Tax=Robiginitalea sp. SC105 TaxID=2762332 RepID=UPI00163A124C|nr:arsenate reductase (glutaredoxin) [Robiginitalea sp. SC105]MBC2840687.1 arsenate reductase (glutaredoxin) [Robiginitalea sp. SC105]